MAEHQAVADAVIAGRPDDAERAMRDLIVLTGSHLGLLLRNRRESGSVEQQGPV
jgi:DNA-binding FadR family transcriptional regulator